jgi:hypothetical protein
VISVVYSKKIYIASAVVEYRIEVRLTDCAIRRSQSFLSSLPISSRRFLEVFAIQVEVICMATEGSSRFVLSIFFLIVARSFVVRWLVKHVADGGFEGCLVGVGSFLFEPVSWILSAVIRTVVQSTEIGIRDKNKYP